MSFSCICATHLCVVRSCHYSVSIPPIMSFLGNFVALSSSFLNFVVFFLFSFQSCRPSGHLSPKSPFSGLSFFSFQSYSKHGGCPPSKSTFFGCFRVVVLSSSPLCIWLIFVFSFQSHRSGGFLFWLNLFVSCSHHYLFLTLNHFTIS